MNLRGLMRIAFVTFEYPPFIIGGAGTYADHITKKLAELGHEIIVFTPAKGIYENVANRKISYIKINEKLPFQALQFWLKLPDAINKENREKKFDLVHFNGHSYWFLKKKLLNTPQILTMHHSLRNTLFTPSNIPRINEINGENSIILPSIEKRAISAVDKIISVSEFTKNQLKDHYGINDNDIEVIYNGIDLDMSLSPNGFRKDRLKDSSNKILFVGRVDDKRKGLDILLRSFQIILEKLDAKLVVVGQGDQDKAKYLAESLNIQEKVKFTGFVETPRLMEYYDNCDVFACPSRLEGFGLTLLDAMARDKPIVASDSGAIPEILADYANGILVEPENPDELAGAILECLTIEKFKETDKSYLREKFSWDNAARKIERIYLDLV